MSSLRFRVYSGFKVSGCRVWGLGLKIFRVSGLRFQDVGSGV